jgi:3-oxoacyl-[acyl-carrier-protein] synthase II
LKSGIVTGGIAAINRYESTGEQAARAVRQAMEAGGVTLGEIDQIDCSANCSHELDGMEAAMLRTVFKSRRESLMVSPLKYRMGDFGGAGAVRAVAILLSMYYQAPLPSTTLDSIDGSVPADFQWHMDISEAVKVSLMTTSTFGGASSGMIFTAAGG